MDPQSISPEDVAGTADGAPDRLLAKLRLAVLALVLVVVALVRVRLLNVPLERDEGEYAYLGQLMLKGVPPFLQVYTMKLPGVGIAYAFIMLLFGETAHGIHLGLLLVNALNALLIYLLARRLLGRDAAAVSCASYALLSLSQSVLGVFAHATHFVVLFSLASFLALLAWRESGRATLLLTSGVLLGFAVIMKQHAAILLLFACFYLAREAWYRGARPAGTSLAAYALFLLGAGLPYALVACWMAASVSFGTFWFWTVSYAGNYASKLTVLEGLQELRHALIVVLPQWPLWLLGALGGVVLGTSRGARTDRAFLYGLSIFSFLTVCPGFYFREHYFIMILPALALLTGFAVATSERAVSRAHPVQAVRAIPMFFFLAAAGYGLFQERNYLFFYSPVEVSRLIYGSSPFPESPRIARYLQEHTSAQDSIAVLGSEPQLYFYAGRTAATTYIYMYGLMEQQPFAVSMQTEMTRQIERARPKYIVMVNSPSSWLESGDSSDLIFRWSARYLPVNYQPVGVIDILTPTNTLYLWDRQIAGYRPKSTSSLVVYGRKTL